MYTSFLCTLIITFWYFGWPVWLLALVVLLKALVLLLPATWLDYLAGTNYLRVQGGGRVVVNPDPEQRGNEPDASFVALYILWPAAAFRNFMTMNIAALFYFRTMPRWKSEKGLTMLLNRLVREDTGWRRERAIALQKRWLNRYDPRGVHT